MAKSILDKWQREEQGVRTSYHTYDKHDDDHDDDGENFLDGHDQNYRELRKNLDAIRQNAIDDEDDEEQEEEGSDEEGGKGAA